MGLLARGHVLIEDIPGVGKTLLALAAARSMGVRFRRIQFTSDTLPSDVLGVNVYDPKNSDFEFREGRSLPKSFWRMKSIELPRARSQLSGGHGRGKSFC